MKNNYFKDEILKLQQEYCTLLKISEKKLNSDEFMYALDEINLFWFANRHKIELFLNYYYGADTVMHTGASFLNVNYNEHFPFVMFGEKHIIDDPVGNFGNVMSMLQENPDLADNIKEQIILTVEQNIKIIENYNDIIQIFPIRLMNIEDKQENIKTAQNAFFQLFKEEDMDLEKYAKTFTTIEDVVNGIKEYCHNYIFFDKDEEQAPLEKRFRDFVGKNKFATSMGVNDAQKFYSLIIGYFIQSIDILFACLKYNMYPYIRYAIPFHYLTLILTSMDKALCSKEIQDIYKMIIMSYALHQNVDLQQFDNVDFIKFYNDLDEKGIKAKIKNQAKVIEVSNQTPIRPLIELSEKYLKNAYDLIVR